MMNRLMKKITGTMLCLSLALAPASCLHAAEAQSAETPAVSEPAVSAEAESAAEIPGDVSAGELLRKQYEKYREEAKADPVRQKELTPETVEYDGDEYPVCTIERDGKKMRFTMEVIGEPDASGLYPLYITLHGGGGGEGADEENDSEWFTMATYYRENVTSGIYVACRGMVDEWNMHFIDEAFPMYDRLIEDMILLKNADPNRVYLLGFSAGGDGVYGVTPRMADRFAAANMSSGHPNGVSLLNTANVPFEIQVGIRDYYTEDVMRSIRGAEFGKTLDEYREKYGFGYEHRILVHVPEGHNYNDHLSASPESIVLADPQEFAERAVKEEWLDDFLELYAEDHDEDPMALSYADPAEDFNAELLKMVEEEFGMKTEMADTNAVHYVDQFVRDPHPANVVWDLATRAPKREVSSFYWLQADFSADKGVIKADFNAGTNTFSLDPSADFEGDFSVLLSPEMVDFERPVNFVTPGGTKTLEVRPDEKEMEASVAVTGDVNLAWAARVKYSELK